MQETKITEDIDTNILDYRLICQKNKPKRWFAGMVSNAQKIRTTYIQSIETKRQNIDPVNTSETTICMCTKWESKNNHQ